MVGGRNTGAWCVGGGQCKCVHVCSAVQSPVSHVSKQGQQDVQLAKLASSRMPLVQGLVLR